MRKIISVLCLSLIFSPLAFCIQSHQKGRRVIVAGEGVTGTWAAAKISENLTQNDELIIVSPPKKDIIKDLGFGVFSNYTTSAFIPIGIQIEMGPINLEPPRRDDVNNGQSSERYVLDSKLYVSPDLDDETKNKLEQYITRDQSKNISSIILRYHRDICLTEWKKYIEKGGKGADFVGPDILSPDTQSLEKIKEKIIQNRMNSGYPADDKNLNVLGPENMAALLPRYAYIIKAKKLSGLVGLDNDGRVKSKAVMTTLNKKIQHGKPKIVKIHAWVESLQTHKDDKGSTIVTGINLSNKKTLNADVVVLALGQGVEKVLQPANLHLPILKKWGVVYSLSPDPRAESKEQPTIIMKGLGIVRDMPDIPVNVALGEWILPKGVEPNPKNVMDFVKQSSLIINKEPNNPEEWKKPLLPVYVQPRPMTLDGLPVLDSSTKGLIILNPSGSQGNTQAPGSAYFAASKVLEQLGRSVPTQLKLPNTIDWKQFELYPGRFKDTRTTIFVASRKWSRSAVDQNAPFKTL